MAFLRATGKLGVRRICQQGLDELGMIFELATVMQQGFDELGKSLQLGMVFLCCELWRSLELGGLFNNDWVS